MVDLDRVPFEFLPAQHPYIYEGITCVGRRGPGTLYRSVERNGLTHHYFQSTSRPNEFAYLPDAFKILRRSGTVRGPALTVQFSSTDVSLDQTRATIEYSAAPVFDAERLEGRSLRAPGVRAGPRCGRWWSPTSISCGVRQRVPRWRRATGTQLDRATTDLARLDGSAQGRTL
jgi:hypothetical protein